MTDDITAQPAMTTAPDWEAIASAMCAEAEAWQRRADEADDQPALPELLATDFAIVLREACGRVARAAQTAADLAALYASDDVAAVA